MRIAELKGWRVPRRLDLGCWADVPKNRSAGVSDRDELALNLSSREVAAAAYWQAERMYDAWAEGFKVASQRLGKREAI